LKRNNGLQRKQGKTPQENDTDDSFKSGSFSESSEKEEKTVRLARIKYLL